MTSGNQEFVDKYLFRVNFDNIKYTGNSTVRNVKTAPPGARTTFVVSNFFQFLMGLRHI